MRSWTDTVEGWSDNRGIGDERGSEKWGKKSGTRKGNKPKVRNLEDLEMAKIETQESTERGNPISDDGSGVERIIRDADSMVQNQWPR
jgi:hypothetical protein